MLGTELCTLVSLPITTENLYGGMRCRRHNCQNLVLQDYYLEPLMAAAGYIRKVRNLESVSSTSRDRSLRILFELIPYRQSCHNRVCCLDVLGTLSRPQLI